MVLKGKAFSKRSLLYHAWVTLSATVLGFVIGMWVFQLIISSIWLKRFRYGPAEWLWRVLTYGKIEKMSIK